MVCILETHTLLPEYKYSSEEVIHRYKKWISEKNQSFQSKALKIFESAAIKERHTIFPLEVIFSKRSFEESNNLYMKKAVDLGTEVLRQTLEKSGIKPEDLDFIITTSCTGFMIPSVDAYIINNLGLRKDIKRLPVTEMGCAAGVSALIYASDFLKAYPNKKAAIVTLEFPSNTIQLDDFSWDNIVGTALFADGAACVILSKDTNNCPQIIDSQMYHMPDTTDILGYNITNTGLKMTLNKKLPNLIEEKFENIVAPFLARNNLKIKDVDSYLVHPGGMKILSKIESILAKYNKNADSSRKIMETYGNLSSSTILFILNDHLEKNIMSENILLLSFGPGFTAQQMLLKR